MNSAIAVALASSLVLASFATGARADPTADTPSAPPPDKSVYNLFNPTPTADLRAFCTDSPTKSNGPCTVDAGYWQIESDIYNVTYQNVGGVQTTTQLFTNPTLKLGVTNTIDLEVNMAPWEQVSVHDSRDGRTQSASGIGDLYLRAKFNILGDDGGAVSVTLLPWVKAPTAPQPVGNGAVEEGLLVPIAFSLPGNLQLTIDPEFDALADSVGPGRHLNVASPISLSYPATKTITVFAEVWGSVNYDPAGTVVQASADVAAAWIPAKFPTLQFDAGLNFGLNHATPAVQAYVGVSHRF